MGFLDGLKKGLKDAGIGIEVGEKAVEVAKNGTPDGGPVNSDNFARLIKGQTTFPETERILGGPCHDQMMMFNVLTMTWYNRSKNYSISVTFNKGKLSTKKESDIVSASSVLEGLVND